MDISSFFNIEKAMKIVKFDQINYYFRCKCIDGSPLGWWKLKQITYTLKYDKVAYSYLAFTIPINVLLSCCQELSTYQRGNVSYKVKYCSLSLILIISPEIELDAAQ